MYVTMRGLQRLLTPTLVPQAGSFLSLILPSPFPSPPQGLLPSGTRNRVSSCDTEEVVKKRDAEIKKGGKLKSLEERVAELAKVLVKVKTQVDLKQNKFSGLQNEEKAKNLALERILTSHETQLAVEDMGQLADARARAAQAAAEEEKSKVRLGMAEKELKVLEARWKGVEREAGDGKKAIEKTKAGESGGRTVEGRGKCCDHRDRVKQGLGRLNFDYVSPGLHFNRVKVRGLVATLITLDKEKNYIASTALEIVAGEWSWRMKDGRRVGQLKKRVTLIPLNKVNAFTISAQRLQTAQRLAPGKVRPVLTRRMWRLPLPTFSQRCRLRSVTLEGDKYDPSGTPSLSAEWKRRVPIKMLEQEEDKSKKPREELTKGREMKGHELKLLKEQVEGSNTVVMLRSDRNAEEKQKAANDECKKLERDMAEFKNKRRELAKLHNQVKAAHANVEANLQEELATLSRSDNKLKSLEQVLKEKKAGIANVCQT
ncbi:hypothetical protein JOM56_005159 [Amanita muscaria]